METGVRNIQTAGYNGARTVYSAPQLRSNYLTGPSMFAIKAVGPLVNVLILLPQ